MTHYNDMNAFYNAKEIECLRKRAWLEDGVLIVSISEPLLGTVEKNWLIGVGDRLYGDTGRYDD